MSKVYESSIDIPLYFPIDHVNLLMYAVSLGYEVRQYEIDLLRTGIKYVILRKALRDEGDLYLNCFMEVDKHLTNPNTYQLEKPPEQGKKVSLYTNEYIESYTALEYIDDDRKISYFMPHQKVVTGVNFHVNGSDSDFSVKNDCSDGNIIGIVVRLYFIGDPPINRFIFHTPLWLNLENYMTELTKLPKQIPVIIGQPVYLDCLRDKSFTGNLKITKVIIKDIPVRKGDEIFENGRIQKAEGNYYLGCIGVVKLDRVINMVSFCGKEITGSIGALDFPTIPSINMVDTFGDNGKIKCELDVTNNQNTLKCYVDKRSNTKKIRDRILGVVVDTSCFKILDWSKHNSSNKKDHIGISKLLLLMQYMNQKNQ